jgi:hypothetical protein
MTRRRQFNKTGLTTSRRDMLFRLSRINQSGQDAMQQEVGAPERRFWDS